MPLHFFYLFLIEDMRQHLFFCWRLKTCNFYRWNCEFCLFNFVINCLIKVLTHVCFQYHWKMISIPFSLITPLKLTLRLLNYLHLTLILLYLNSLEINVYFNFLSPFLRAIVHLQLPINNEDKHPQAIYLIWKSLNLNFQLIYIQLYIFLLVIQKILFQVFHHSTFLCNQQYRWSNQERNWDNLNHLCEMKFIHKLKIFEIAPFQLKHHISTKDPL